MWFKNLNIYKFSKPFSLNSSELQAQLETMRFRGCGAQEIESMGFVPLLEGTDTLFHGDDNAIAFSLQIERRMLPASVVNAELATQVQTIELDTGSPVSKKAQKELKEDIINRLLPQAFTKRHLIRGLLLRQEQLMLVDASSDKQSEILLACIRKCIESLPVIPIVSHPQHQVLTEWLTIKCPAPFALADEVELVSAADQGGMVKVKREAVDSSEVLAHIQAGKWVEKLAVEFDQRISFIITDSLQLKRIKYIDELKDTNQDIPKEDKAARFDADFVLFTEEMRSLGLKLLENFTESSN